MKIGIIGVFLFFIALTSLAQEKVINPDSAKFLKEVKVRAPKWKRVETKMKINSSVDEYLSGAENISFIKRGAFAWEPLLNNMSTERTSLTIDGMHIFGACTDKMDPVTAYVESNNISHIDIQSGQAGGMHGSTIAGNIDLIRRKTTFALKQTLNGSLQSGFEINNKQLYNLGTLAYSSKRFVADGSISFRKAGNYTDGNNNEVKHSQFTKFNSSLALAYKTSDLSSFKVDAIFDEARNVGYPALPMDLWLSRAIITSASYKQLFEHGIITGWDSRVYFNTIEHYMDDTTRPENKVHMDMPGWSTTYGLLSKLNLQKGDYSSEIQLNSYNNLSIAEMRMYPQDRSKRTMFAYSWPWVTTRFTGLSINNHYSINENSQLHFLASLGWNYNRSKYIEFNWIFHPGAAQQKNRWLPSAHVSYNLNIDNVEFVLGTGYGQRAPSVSEGYGYYIYNSFDRYDYIGNPDLKNETSYEGNFSAALKSDKGNVKLSLNYFYIQNYIIGQILSLGSPMNYQSVGVKGYTSLPYATLFNLSASANYQLIKQVLWSGNVTYARGLQDNGRNLPFIRPLSYQTSLQLKHNRFGMQTQVSGDFLQENYSPEYGEDQTPGYFIWNASADYRFKIKKVDAVLQCGVENLLNRYYSTYADWGNIPRMGRNIYTSVKFNF